MNSLTRVVYSNGHLKSLPPIPNQCIELYCGNNQLTSLPSLTHLHELQILTCNTNKLRTLPDLPSSLKTLGCWGNQLTSLPTLPEGLEVLICDDNILTSLPTLPQSLKRAYINHNQLIALTELPKGLTTLNCSHNQIGSLPDLPDTLEDIYTDFDSRQIRLKQHNDKRIALGLSVVNVLPELAERHDITARYTEYLYRLDGDKYIASIGVKTELIFDAKQKS